MEMIKNKTRRSDTQLSSALPAVSRAMKKTTCYQLTGAEEVIKPSARETAAHREVTFAVYKPQAQRVFVSGAFNGWSKDATPLIRRPNRDWKTTIPLTPGLHEYKFVVDGNWMIDPRASKSSANGLGTLNSVIEVKA
jgi:1,4-alpha-glucan branching enzyme